MPARQLVCLDVGSAAGEDRRPLMPENLVSSYCSYQNKLFSACLPAAGTLLGMRRGMVSQIPLSRNCFLIVKDKKWHQMSILTDCKYNEANKRR